ncbi:hypothetical protein D3C76_1190150 [compost metagenome]
MDPGRNLAGPASSRHHHRLLPAGLSAATGRVCRGPRQPAGGTHLLLRWRCGGAEQLRAGQAHLASASADQRLRPDRNRGHAVVVERCCRCRMCCGLRANRYRRRCAQPVHPRPPAQPGADRRGRRAVPGRHGTGARLPPPSGAECRALRRRPVRWPGWPSVPHRRSGAPACRWCHRLPRAPRPSGQGPWFPHRAG